MSRSLPHPDEGNSAELLDQSERTDRTFDLQLLALAHAARCRPSLAKPLCVEERARRRADLRALWRAGARYAIDEGLLADIVARRSGQFGEARVADPVSASSATSAKELPHGPRTG